MNQGQPGKAMPQGHCTVSVAALMIPPALAEIVTDCATGTRVVFTVKIALVKPCCTMTNPGTCAVSSELLKRFTMMPPAGAGAASVTVPCVLRPPVIVFGEIERPMSTGAGGGLTVSVAVAVIPKYAAEMFTVRLPGTVEVVMLNVPKF